MMFIQLVLIIAEAKLENVANFSPSVCVTRLAVMGKYYKYHRWLCWTLRFQPWSMLKKYREFFFLDMYHDIMDRVRNTAETFQNSCMFKSWWRNTFCTLLYFLSDMAAVSCFLSFLQTHARTHTYTHTVVCVVCRWVHHTLMFKEQGCSCVLWSDPLPKIHPSSPFLIHNHTHTMRRHTHTCAVCADTHTWQGLMTVSDDRCPDSLWVWRHGCACCPAGLWHTMYQHTLRTCHTNTALSARRLLFAATCIFTFAHPPPA